MIRLCVIGLLLLMPALAYAQSVRVSAIQFEGNKTTQESVLLREIEFSAGDTITNDEIERARQAIQNLGLFRDVSVAQKLNDDGSSNIVFSVTEKWYVLPIPRFEANSDGEYGYGAQLRWDNILGLNHSLSLIGIQRTYENDDRDSSTAYSAGFVGRQILHTRNDLTLNYAHADQNSFAADRSIYQEVFDSASMGLSRHLSDGASTQGWRVGGGLQWQRQSATGISAPESYGQAIGAFASLSLRDLKFNIYSEEGSVFSASVGAADDGFGSDYSYQSYAFTYSRFIPVGNRAHQTVNIKTSLAAYHQGPRSRPQEGFSLGGASILRGYENDSIEGDFIYYGALEWLRPVYREWLRTLVVLEAGSAHADVEDNHNLGLYASLGVGLRARFTWFVRFELEAGLAIPLIKGDGLQVFAGGV